MRYHSVCGTFLRSTQCMQLYKRPKLQSAGRGLGHVAFLRPRGQHLISKEMPRFRSLQDIQFDNSFCTAEQYVSCRGWCSCQCIVVCDPRTTVVSKAAMLPTAQGLTGVLKGSAASLGCAGLRLLQSARQAVTTSCQVKTAVRSRPCLRRPWHQPPLVPFHTGTPLRS